MHIDRNSTSLYVEGWIRAELEPAELLDVVRAALADHPRLVIHDHDDDGVRVIRRTTMAYRSDRISLRAETRPDGTRITARSASFVVPWAYGEADIRDVFAAIGDELDRRASEPQH
ncbi:hypothetical protein WDJ51_07790 [Rathayibacter sp. YIM 133350]|uniref:hypothetical protein n=1 Tax=Rathayibacter sp. YIM 133350 TaxID=3131992 RepID=UPI00307D27BB